MKIFAKKKKGFTLIEHEPSERVRRNAGFTLIELLVVIAIIGLLASIVLVSLSGARNRAKDARIIADMGQLRTSAMVFYDNYTSYTPAVPAPNDNLCTNTDITKLQADIVAQGGTNFACNRSATDYCIEARMNSLQWWCINHALESKQCLTGAPSCAVGTYTCTCL